MRLSAITGRLLPMAVLLSTIATGCGTANSQSSSGDSGSSSRQGHRRAIAINQSESVVPGQQDSLTPLPPGVTPKLSADQVLKLLNQDPASALYLQHPAALTVLLGLYTNKALTDSTGSPTIDVPSYVFKGGRGACPPRTGGPGDHSTEPSAATCTAIIIGNATSGEREILSEWVVQ